MCFALLFFENRKACVSCLLPPSLLRCPLFQNIRGPHFMFFAAFPGALLISSYCTAAFHGELESFTTQVHKFLPECLAARSNKTHSTYSYDASENLICRHDIQKS
jgi:hypothetical protein